MRSHPTPESAVRPDVVTLVAGTWLACGIVLLGLTPLPAHTAALGWSPAFWLLFAPTILLCARGFCLRRATLHTTTGGRGQSRWNVAHRRTPPPPRVHARRARPTRRRNQTA